MNKKSKAEIILLGFMFHLTTYLDGQFIKLLNFLNVWCMSICQIPISECPFFVFFKYIILTVPNVNFVPVIFSALVYTESIVVLPYKLILTQVCG